MATSGSARPSRTRSPASPSAIITGPDGSLWFGEINASKIGRMTPQGVLTEFPLVTDQGGPAFFAVGADGNIWFTETSVNKIARITP